MIEQLVTALEGMVGDARYIEIGEPDILALLRGASALDGLDAAERWETLSLEFRRRVVCRNRVYEWNLFRRVLCVSVLPGREELERVQEIYNQATPRELEAKIRSLSGRQFELFLGELLPKLDQFRNVVITKASADRGVDFRASYLTSADTRPLAVVGQAKQLATAVGNRDAREFVGALQTCGEQSPVGLFISTSGFTRPAMEAFDSCSYTVWRWSMPELLQRVIGIGLGMTEAAVTVRLIDSTFWDELRRDTPS